MGPAKRLAFLAVALAALLPLPALCDDWPPYVIEWPEETADLFVVDTSRPAFYRFTRDGDGRIERSEFYTSIGDNGVGKRRDRDRRTPLGVYFVVDELDTRPLHPSYGPAAFPLDYPNARDRQLGRTGGGIWIHGVLPGAGPRPPRDTDGCLALPNESLAVLGPLMRLRTTPVIIARSIDEAEGDARQVLREELLAAIDAWREYLEAGRFVDWRSLYAEDFRYQGLALDEYAGLRLDEFLDPNVRAVETDEIFIAEDPEEADVFVSRFNLRVDVGSQVLTRVTRLYWRRDAGGALRIIAEDEA